MNKKLKLYTAAVIPVYNESRFIEKVVTETKKYVDLVIVADDNSLDDTRKRAEKVGAYVITHKSNVRGSGKNTQIGLTTALYKNADIVVTLDGDGQHNPSDIPQLIQPIIDGQADFVNGSRFTKRDGIPLYRRLGISIITYAFNFGHKTKVSDSQCGFRAFSKEVLEKVQVTEKGFGFSVESLVKIRANNFRIKEVPINCIYHGSLKLNSSMNPIKHGFIVLCKVLYWRLKVEILRKSA